MQKRKLNITNKDGLIPSIDIKSKENIKLLDYINDKTLMSKIISVICDWNILYPELDGQKHDQDILQKIHMLFVQGLEDLCCMDGKQLIRGYWYER